MTDLEVQLWTIAKRIAKSDHFTPEAALRFIRDTASQLYENALQASTFTRASELVHPTSYACRDKREEAFAKELSKMLSGYAKGRIP